MLRKKRQAAHGGERKRRAPFAGGRRTPEQAKAEIIDAARDILSSRDFHELTIGALMERTQIGRSAFYAYYKDIYDLAEVFIHEIARGIEDSVDSWLNDDGGVPFSRANLQKGVEFWRANARMIRALDQASSRDRKLRQLWRTEVAMRPITRMAAAIRRDQEAGLIGPMDADAMSLALNRFMLGYLSDCFGGREQANVTTVVDTLERVWLGTLYGNVGLPGKPDEAPALPSRRTRKSNRLAGNTAKQN
jgi:AcrR family transcriptional regulator